MVLSDPDLAAIPWCPPRPSLLIPSEYYLELNPPGSPSPALSSGIKISSRDVPPGLPSTRRVPQHHSWSHAAAAGAGCGVRGAGCPIPPEPDFLCSKHTAPGWSSPAPVLAGSLRPAPRHFPMVLFLVPRPAPPRPVEAPPTHRVPVVVLVTPAPQLGLQFAGQRVLFRLAQKARPHHGLVAQATQHGGV